MNKIFKGYYRPTDAEFIEIWRTCLFVFDANVLLNLYSYSPTTNKAFFGFLRKISDRIFLPHQAALEYQDNRLKAITLQESTYDGISKIMTEAKEKLEALLQEGHASIDTDYVLKTFDHTFTSIRTKLAQHKTTHPDLLKNDEIRNELTLLFEDKSCLAYTQEQLNEFEKIGEDRFKNFIPPGYKDKGKKEEIKRFGELIIKSKYGDLILWNQLIDKATELKRPVLFITDDRKEDWWWIESGKTIGPRPELITEIWQKANVQFYMYSPTRFMENANNYLGTRINQRIIDEVREVSDSKLGWLDLIIEALNHLGGESDLNNIYKYIEENTDRNLSKSWQSVIRRTLYNYSSDVEAYLGGDDLFQHRGKGRWGLRSLKMDSNSSVNNYE